MSIVYQRCIVRMFVELKFHPNQLYNSMTIFTTKPLPCHTLLWRVAYEVSLPYTNMYNILPRCRNAVTAGNRGDHTLTP